MTEEKELKFWWTVTPGEFLQEKMDEMGIDVKEMASRTGYTPKTINEILKAKCAVTTEVAINLEYATGTATYFWINSQREYEEFLLRQKVKKSLNNQSLWRKGFPLHEINDRNWVDDINNREDGVSPLLRFFCVASPKAWENYYFKANLKASFNISLAEAQDPYAASVWMRRGEILAEEIKMEKPDDKKLRAALKKSLPKFIELAAEYGPKDCSQKGPKKSVGKPGEIDEGMVKLQELCASFNIKLLYVQNFKSAPIHGMSRWYRGVPLIQIHDRFKDKSLFWFTFFHELAHIILHGKKDIFVKNMYHGNKNPQKEEEANCFAQKCMVDAGLQV